MRVNRYIALSTGISRRAADVLVQAGRVRLNDRPAAAGDEVTDSDSVSIDGRRITPPVNTTTIMLHKPPGYVVSRRQQGSPTVYDLLPPDLHRLKPVGRLDKESSGLLLMTDDGQLHHRLTHPGFEKSKLYSVTLDKPLTADHRRLISNPGIDIGIGGRPSSLDLQPDEQQGRASDNGRHWQVRLSEGRNRQIRRTFAALGYRVIRLHRTQQGDLVLGGLPPAKFRRL